MNLFRIFEGPEIKQARAQTEDLKTMVELAKADQRAAEEELRKKLARAQDALDRPAVARALGWREPDHD